MKRNLTFFMQMLALTVVLALIVPVNVHAQAGKANFAGTWTMNAEKSTPAPTGGGAGGRGFGGGPFTVAQDATTLTQTRTGQDGTARATKYTLDGKETTNTFGQGESKSTATWSADGKSLTLVTKMNFNGNDFTTTAVWSLVDAKTLSIKSTRPGRDGGAPTTTTIVYDKK